MQIYNCGTSDVNHITMGGYKDMMLHSYRNLRFNKQAFPVSLEFVADKKMYQLKKGLWVKTPLKVYNMAASLPFLGTKSLKSKVDQLNKFQAKADNSVDIMMLFINTDWRFENKRILNVIRLLSPEERAEFDCDCQNISW